MLQGHAPSCETTAVMARVQEIRTTMHWSLKCGKKMVALCDESVKDQLADPADDTGQNTWNASQTRMLILHFKENAILWEKCLKDNGNKAKTKKTIAPLISRFRNTQPPKGLKEIKSRWQLACEARY